MERDRDSAEAARERFAFLAEASRCLADSLDYETTLATVAGMSLPYLGSWCIVDICTDDGSIRRLAVLHPDPKKQALARELHQRYPPRADDLIGAPRVLRTGRPELVVDVPDETLAASARDAEHLALLRALGTKAYVVAPMVARGRTLGAITFVTADAARRFGDVDVLLAEDLARRAAIAVDNARLYTEAEAARRVAEEALQTGEAATREAEAAAEDARTARKMAEAALKARADFLAVMSHELRTPLNAIAGYAELLEMGIRGPVTPQQREDLRRVQHNQRHLLGLVNEVLNYAKLETGAVHFDITDVSVEEAVAAVEPLVAPQLRAKRLVYVNRGCEGGAAGAPVVVRADREKLQQVLLNLLSNAVKFTRGGGRVEISCTPMEGEVAIRVHDTGRGIPAEKLTAIFEPFVQLDARLTRTEEGVGLGLAISRDLARSMGGDLTAESDVGRGSTFTLTLPRAGFGEG